MGVRVVSTALSKRDISQPAGISHVREVAREIAEAPRLAELTRAELAKLAKGVHLVRLSGCHRLSGRAGQVVGVSCQA